MSGGMLEWHELEAAPAVERAQLRN
jgi:hypothetical protein